METALGATTSPSRSTEGRARGMANDEFELLPIASTSF
ncbi:hypothetical protein X771_25515 [Mesorhizobium sp. LSJC277A00]|nr:hypothetical protein X771_25515 [Mesorhizobium sp. LSJC277A00]